VEGTTPRLGKKKLWRNEKEKTTLETLTPETSKTGLLG